MSAARAECEDNVLRLGLCPWWPELEQVPVLVWHSLHETTMHHHRRPAPVVHGMRPGLQPSLLSAGPHCVFGLLFFWWGFQEASGTQAGLWTCSFRPSPRRSPCGSSSECSGVVMLESVSLGRAIGIASSIWGRLVPLLVLCARISLLRTQGLNEGRTRRMSVAEDRSRGHCFARPPHVHIAHSTGTLVWGDKRVGPSSP